MTKAPASRNHGASQKINTSIVAGSTTENQEIFLKKSKYSPAPGCSSNGRLAWGGVA